MAIGRGARQSFGPFHNCLYEWRMQAGLTQGEVGAEMGRGRFQIGRLEKADPLSLAGKAWLIARIGAVCHVSPEEVLAFLIETANGYDIECEHCREALRDLSVRHAQEHLNISAPPLAIGAEDRAVVFEEIQENRRHLPQASEDLGQE